MARSLRTALLLSLSLTLVIACDDDGSPTAPPTVDALQIRSASPADGATVPAGQGTHIDVSFHYRFARATRGRLALIALQGGATGLTDISAGTVSELSSGEGDLSIGFDVPVRAASAGGTVTMSFSLIPENAAEGSARASISYRVAA